MGKTCSLLFSTIMMCLSVSVILLTAYWGDLSYEPTEPMLEPLFHLVRLKYIFSPQSHLGANRKRILLSKFVLCACPKESTTNDRRYHIEMGDPQYLKCWPGRGVPEQDQAEPDLWTESQEAHLHQEVHRHREQSKNNYGPNIVLWCVYQNGLLWFKIFSTHIFKKSKNWRRKKFIEFFFGLLHKIKVNFVLNISLV